MSKKSFFCDDCGTRNTPDSKYCKECGSQIHAAYQTLALSAYDHMDDDAQQERLTQFLDMAFWHTEAGNTDAALRACEAALALNSNSTTAHSLLGSLYEKKGDDAQAIKHFERVLALNPDSEADRTKLMQLREGIHARPVRPSSVYRWLPPAFANARFSSLFQSAQAKWADLRRPEMTLLPVRLTPALAAGVAAILVLAVCLFAVRPGPQASATMTASLPHQSVAGSAYGGAASFAAPAVPPMPAPVVLPASPGTPLPTPTPMVSSVAALPRNDPFASSSAFPRSASFLPAYAPRLPRSRARTLGHAGLHPLPALSLVAVPPASDGPLLPAPVQMPASAHTASPYSSYPSYQDPYADIARHTVAVQRLDGRSSAQNGGLGSAPAATPHIEITIDRSPAPSTGASANTGVGGATGAGGETYQQAAFALQQQGDYRKAQAAYEKAVNAYQTQIAAGRDLDAASRGLQACKTGLQICQQSQ